MLRELRLKTLLIVISFILYLLLPIFSQTLHTAHAATNRTAKYQYLPPSFPTPSWWSNPNCDADYYNTHNKAGKTAILLKTWRGIEACGPQPQGNTDFDAPVQFNLQSAGEFEWECPELVSRYLLIAYGVPAIVADGAHVVTNYYNTYPNLFRMYTNPATQSHVFPQEGDVLSYTNSDPSGHTAIVTKLKITDKVNGNGSITIMDENGVPSLHGVATHQIIGWNVQDNNDGGHVTSWLTPKQWRIVPTSQLSTIDVYGTTAVADNNVWAVGDQYNASLGVTDTLIEHSSGSKWQPVRSPNLGLGANSLASVAAINATDIWAVGYFPNSSGTVQTLTMHYGIDKKWTIVNSPNIGTSQYDYNVFSGVAADGTNNVWAVGAYFNSYLSLFSPLAEHWNGTSWSILPTPTYAFFYQFYSVTAVGGSDAWGVGNSWDNNGEHALIVHWHWDGTQWIYTDESSQIQGNILYGVTATSPIDVWAVGANLPNNIGEYPLTAHWDGNSWKVISLPPTPLAAQLNSVSANADNNVWAVGWYQLGNYRQTMTMHWDGNGWTIIPSPNKGSSENRLYEVAVTPIGAWAVGIYYNTAYYMLAEHFS